MIVHMPSRLLAVHVCIFPSHYRYCKSEPANYSILNTTRAVVQKKVHVTLYRIAGSRSHRGITRNHCVPLPCRFPKYPITGPHVADKSCFHKAGLWTDQATTPYFLYFESMK